MTTITARSVQLFGRMCILGIRIFLRIIFCYIGYIFGWEGEGQCCYNCHHHRDVGPTIRLYTDFKSTRNIPFRSTARIIAGYIVTSWVKGNTAITTSIEQLHHHLKFFVLDLKSICSPHVSGYLLNSSNNPRVTDQMTVSRVVISWMRRYNTFASNIS